MIAVIYRMLSARRVHAATVFALAVVAIAAAVAAPVYLLAAQRSLVAADVAAATPRDTSIVAQLAVSYESPVNGEDPIAPADANVFENEAAEVVRTPGFEPVYAADTKIVISVGKPNFLSADVREASARNGSCEHVIISAGRCPIGPNELMLGQTLASLLGATPGADLTVQGVNLVPSKGSGPPSKEPAGPPRTMSVVGIYRPVDPAAAYWGLDVLDKPMDAANLPVLMNLPTLLALPHTEERRSIVMQALPGTITADRLDQLRADVTKTLSASRDGIVPASGVPLLLGRFEVAWQSLKVVPTFAAVALVMLCWFVIFLAMAHTTEARRGELGLLKLRGLSGSDQAWLALAENVVALVAGGIVGYLVGHLAVWIVAATVLPVPVAVPVTLAPLPYAAITLLGAIAAGVLALRRDLVSPPLELMRRVPGRLGRMRGAIVAIVVTAIAAGSVVQLRADPGKLDGVAVLAPALAVLAGGLLLSRLLDPIAGWSGRRALRRGRIAPALAALHFARRGTGGQALALLVVAVGLLGYAAIAAETADQARTGQVRQSIAADRVLSIGSVEPHQLLDDVRRVDPDGRYAMAVVARPDEARGSVLAVDSPRLPGVMFWPDDAATPASAVPGQLRPQVGNVVTITGSQVLLTATTAGLKPGETVYVRAWVTPADKGPTISVGFPPLRPGQADYPIDVPCAGGCRLGDLTFQLVRAADAPTSSTGSQITVALNGLRQAGPDQQLVSPAAFGGWHADGSDPVRLAPTAQGLTVTVTTPSDESTPIEPPDTPATLPMVTAGSQYTTGVRTIGGTDIAAAAVERMATLPRTGDSGAIVDLEYYSRFTNNSMPTTLGEVWLNDGAPDDILDRLNRAGLVVTGDRRLAAELRTAGQRPEAIGLTFFLAMAVLGLILAVAGLSLVAAVERRSRADELRDLLIQGLPRRAVRSTSLRAYLLLAVPAALLGAVVAEVGWALTRAAIPTGEPVSNGFALVLPGPRALLAWAATAVVLILTAIVLGAALSRAAIRSPQTDARRAGPPDPPDPSMLVDAVAGSSERSPV